MTLKMVAVGMHDGKVRVNGLVCARCKFVQEYSAEYTDVWREQVLPELVCNNCDTGAPQDSKVVRTELGWGTISNSAAFRLSTLIQHGAKSLIILTASTADLSGTVRGYQSQKFRTAPTAFGLVFDFSLPGVLVRSLVGTWDSRWEANKMHEDVVLKYSERLQEQPL